MPGLTIADVKTILDSIAQQAVNIKTLGFNANASGYTNNRATILARMSSSDLTPGADLGAKFNSDVPVTINALFEDRRKALDTHLSGLAAYLQAQDARVSHYLRDILAWVLPGNTTFQEPLTGSAKLASFVLTGSGAGTFTAGTPVPVATCGKSWITLKVTGPGGGVTTSIVVTIIGLKADGTVQTKTKTITGGSAAVGSFWNVGTLGTAADHFMSVSNITVTGGEATDAFDVETQLERVIAL